MFGKSILLLIAVVMTTGSAQLNYISSGSCEVSHLVIATKVIIMSVTTKFIKITVIIILYLIILLYMQSEQTCEYVYSVEQQSFKRDGDDPITVSITVQLTCESSKHLINLLICMG